MAASFSGNQGCHLPEKCEHEERPSFTEPNPRGQDVTGFSHAGWTRPVIVPAGIAGHDRLPPNLSVILLL